MNELFVPYIEASQLKELGFNLPCFAVYDLEYQVKWSIDKPFFKNDSIGYTLRPLYTQAFKFFRDNFGLYQHIQRISENWYTPVLSASGKFRLGHIGQEFSNRYKFNTHEEAELECLRKLIQIVKKQIDEITE